jgi:geranylgeranyl diphosphate synthase type II
VDEKTLLLIQEHNELAQEYLNKINVSDEKKKPFIELANYLLRRDS